MPQITYNILQEENKIEEAQGIYGNIYLITLLSCGLRKPKKDQSVYPVSDRDSIPRHPEYEAKILIILYTATFDYLKLQNIVDTGSLRKRMNDSLFSI
jgi:hypothetical protein